MSDSGSGYSSIKSGRNDSLTHPSPVVTKAARPLAVNAMPASEVVKKGTPEPGLLVSSSYSDDDEDVVPPTAQAARHLAKYTAPPASPAHSSPPPVLTKTLTFPASSARETTQEAPTTAKPLPVPVPAARNNGLETDVSSASSDDAPPLGNHPVLKANAIPMTVFSPQTPHELPYDGAAVSTTTLDVQFKETDSVRPNPAGPVPPPEKRANVPVEEGESDDEGEESPLMNYLFPRIDVRLAEDPLPRTLQDEDPPNFVEVKIAELLHSPWYHSAHLGVSCFSFLLLLVSLPLSQIDMVGNACYTYWGYKADCDSMVYIYPTAIIPCDSTKTSLMVGCAFAFVALLGQMALTLLSAYQVFMVDRPNSPLFVQGGRIKLFIDILNGFVSVLHLVAWAPIAAVYNSGTCEIDENEMAYGVGFGLGMAVWVARLLMAGTYVIYPRLSYLGFPVD